MSEKNGSADSPPEVEVLRDEIRQTRAELGETVQALAAKADVKARAKESVEQTKQRVRQSAVEATEKLRGQATQATGKLRGQATQATGKLRGQATNAVHTAVASAEDASQRARKNPVPWASVAAAGVAIVVVLLVIRGRRR